MIRNNIDREWEFSKGKPSDMVVGFMFPKNSKTVNLPHDFMVETDTFAEAPGGHQSGYYGGGVGTYTKQLDIPKEDAGQRILLEFDGAYMNTIVNLNGHVIRQHHNGYSPFHADLTSYIKYGSTNRLSVTVSNAAQPSERWYSGAGLYRHVDLLKAPKLHIAPWGIYAYTSHVLNGNAYVVVETTVENHTDETKKLYLELEMKKEGCKTVAAIGKTVVFIPAGVKSVGRVVIAVESAELWDLETPNLYQITANLSDGISMIDSESTSFGIRTISVDPQNGFRLNGRTIKLKGGCVHHDNGILGSASFKDSEYRKLKLHKDNGYNAIRCAHNAPSRDMLDLCDQLGLLVIDEAFDSWTMGKTDCDYSLYFEEHWKADMEAFMLRDRNHPCIIMWSTGNEIIERGGLSNGYQWAAELAAWARKLDPTRFIINSVCSFFNGLEDSVGKICAEEMMKEVQATGSIQNLDTAYSQKIWGELTDAYLAPLDIAGYNYLAHRYEEDRKKYPNRVICGTESKPLEMDEYWEAVLNNSHVIGDFTWTSYDYIGEAGLGKAEYVDPEAPLNPMSAYQAQYPWRLSNDADFDLCGFGRPQLAYRRIVWGSNETYIASHNPKNRGMKEILGRWGWPECDNSWSWFGYEGKPVQVDVYSAAEEVELLLNGKSLGKQPAGKAKRYRATFDLTFEPGVLEAISYRNGEKVSSDLLKSAGKPAGIRITPEKSEITADGQSLNFAVVEIIDENGNRVPTAELKAIAKVEGVAVLAAFGTGRPQTIENYTKGEFTSYQGRLLAIIRSGYEAGDATLTVEIEGIGSESTVISVNSR